jgi:hypothetical protein
MFTLAPGQASAQVGGSSISGMVWQDDNANGQREQAEPDIGGAKVILSGVAIDRETITDAGGRYSFAGLEPGQYQVGLGSIVSGMWIQTHPSENLIGSSATSVSLAGTAQTADFGLYPSAGLPGFRGTAWNNAEPVAAPSVRALVNGIDCTLPALMPPTSEPNRFVLKVASEELKTGCGKDGSTIRFILNGTPANETATWSRAPITQHPPGVEVTVPQPPGIAPPLANTRSITLTVGAPFAAYSGGVIDASTGERLDIAAPPRFPSVDAYIGDTLCGSITAYGDPGAQLVVPSEQLRLGCGREGALVRFVVDGAPAPEQVAWTPGIGQLMLTLSNANVPAGIFRIVISAEALNSPVSRAGTGFDTLGQALGTLTVLANGTPCVEIDVANRQADVVVDLGRTGPPPECATESATITFEDQRRIPLAARMALTKGTQRRLSNFAPEPPSSGSGSSAGPMSQSQPAITPPDTGDAGFVR